MSPEIFLTAINIRKKQVDSDVGVSGGAARNTPSVVLLAKNLIRIFTGIPAMHIMMMTQNYAPEEVSGAVLLTEFTMDLVKMGHRVTVVTVNPSYPYGKVFPGYRNKAYNVEWLNGVRVVRTWSYISPKKTFWRRIFNYASYSLTSFWGSLVAGRPDVLVVDSLPLSSGIVAWVLSVIWRIPWVLRVEDIYPEAAVSMGILQNRTVISFFEAVERFLYRKATQIAVISEGFRCNLLRKGTDASKITVIPVWADPNSVKPLPKENAFREKHGLTGKFVVMYAGNLGITSCVEDILPSAEMLLNEPRIHFVIIGEGVKRAQLEAMAKNKNLINVLLLPYQPREAFSEMMAAADVSVVTLNHLSSVTSLPSKTFNIMSSARSILAVTPPKSEITDIVRDAECGINVPPNQPALLAKTILEMMQQSAQMARMGENGRIYLENHFSRSRCVTAYEQMLRDIYKRSKGNPNI